MKRFVILWHRVTFPIKAKTSASIDTEKLSGQQRANALTTTRHNRERKNNTHTQVVTIRSRSQSCPYLPEPTGPTTAARLPCGTVKLMSLSATTRTMSSCSPVPFSAWMTAKLWLPMFRELAPDCCWCCCAGGFDKLPLAIGTFCRPPCRLSRDAANIVEKRKGLLPQVE